MNDISTINGVKITTDENGNQHFELADKTSSLPAIDNRSLWQKLKDWFSNASVTPYAKIRNLSDPTGKLKTDGDADCPKTAVEVGFRIRF